MIGIFCCNFFACGIVVESPECAAGTSKVSGGFLRACNLRGLRDENEDLQRIAR